MNRKKINIFTVGVIIILVVLLKSINFQISNMDLLLNPKLITPVSPLYYLKISREYLQSKFVFGDEDLANWYFTLAEKRIAEARLLKNYGFKSLKNQQKKLAQYYQDLGWSHLKVLIDVININYLKDKFDKNEQQIKELN